MNTGRLSLAAAAVVNAATADVSAAPLFIACTALLILLLLALLLLLLQSAAGCSSLSGCSACQGTQESSAAAHECNKLTINSTLHKAQS
jgi:hypothetical protein